MASIVLNTNPWPSVVELPRLLQAPQPQVLPPSSPPGPCALCFVECDPSYRGNLCSAKCSSYGATCYVDFFFCLFVLTFLKSKIETHRKLHKTVQRAPSPLHPAPRRDCISHHYGTTQSQETRISRCLHNSLPLHPVGNCLQPLL